MQQTRAKLKLITGYRYKIIVQMNQVSQPNLQLLINVNEGNHSPLGYTLRPLMIVGLNIYNISIRSEIN